MRSASIKKSFKLNSEPAFQSPQALTKLIRVTGFKLRYSGKGMDYTLKPSKKERVVMAEWNPESVRWKNVFSEPRLQPMGLQALAHLHADFTPRKACDWITLNGPLGFRPHINPSTAGRHLFFNKL